MKIISTKFFFYYLGDGLFWFRLFGKGLAVSHKDKMLFSQRKHFSGFTIGNYNFQVLK